MPVGRRVRMGAACSLFLALPVVSARVRPAPEALEAFDRYAQVTEEELKSAAASKTFLNVDAAKQARIRGGEIVVTERERTGHGRDFEVRKGLIQDWEGVMFVPGATLDRFRSFLQDYNNYKKYYAPAVMESKLKQLQGDQFDVFLRLYKNVVLPVVLNVDYRIQYSFPRPNLMMPNRMLPSRMIIVSRSTRIGEVRNPFKPEGPEYPPENDSGFLWRLNTYWRAEEADGGVYARCEAISLSRDAPLGLGIILKGFLAHFPKESMADTMRQTREALAKH